MTEWQILTSDDFPELPPDEPTRSPINLRWRWLWLGGGIFTFLVIVALTGLYLKRIERQTKIRADLEAAIFEEESLRYLGHAEAALINPNAPAAWQEAYKKNFVTLKAPPDSIEVSEVEFDGQCATISVELSGAAQVRSYCLNNQNWLRAPVPAAVWGIERDVLVVENGVELHFLPRDHTFAQALAQDLAQFYQTLRRQGFWPKAQALTSTLKIRIVPQELQGPLTLAEPQQIVINSPLLTPAQGGLGGEAAVRLALGKELLHGVISPTVQPQLLPGSARLVDAGQTVLAAHALLTPEMRANLLNDWRAQLAGEFAAPFLPELLQYMHTESEEEITLSTQVTAYYLTTLKEPEILYALLAQLPGATSWDDLLQATFNRPTIVIEQEAANFAREDRANAPAVQLPDPPALPLVDSVVTSDKLGSTGFTRAYIQWPLMVVDIPPDVAVRTKQNETVPLDCVRNSQLSITGNWLEAPRRLQAAEITVQQLDRFIATRAPADTVAYLLLGTLTNPHSFVALNPQGKLRLITLVDEQFQIFPLPAMPGQPPHFLFTEQLTDCDRLWFGRYNPDEGTVQHWLAPPDVTQWVWRADDQSLIFLSDKYNGANAEIFETNDTLLARAIGASPAPQTLLGWNVKQAQLVSYMRYPEGSYLALLNLTSGKETPQPNPLWLQGRALSPDGEWLAYLLSSLNNTMPPNRLEVINLSNGSTHALAVMPVREAFWPPVWSPNPDMPQLVTLAGPITEDSLLPLPVRLVVTSPTQPGDYTVVAEAAPNERFASPIFCANGDLLYRAELDGEYRLIHQPPDGQPVTLYTSQREFHPLACP